MHIKLGENTRITAHHVKGDIPTSEANRKSLDMMQSVEPAVRLLHDVVSGASSQTVT